MADVSQVSRYRPAVVVVTSVAAACAIYALCHSFSSRPVKAALHRSNAVHRSRSDTTRPMVQCSAPYEGSTFGDIVIRRGNTILVRNISTDRFPDADEIRDFFGPVPQDFGRDVERAVAEAFLNTCLVSPGTTYRTDSHLDDVFDTDTAELRSAIVARDATAIRRWGFQIQLWDPNISITSIDLAVEGLISSNRWPTVRGPGSEQNDMILTAPENLDILDDGAAEPSQGLKGLLYHIAEQDAQRKAYEHRGINCDECGERPIRGIRWHCLNCPGFDLCSTCEADSPHPKTHVFAKIKIPLPILSQPNTEYQLWYPGDPTRVHTPLDPTVKMRLETEYAFEGPQIDAHYDQFLCLANVFWPTDPNGVMAAIDTKAFQKAMTSERWPPRFKRNYLLDRVFAFYDTNRDDLIGFEEFVSGMAYLRGTKPYANLDRALQGVDADKDGFVDRTDFVRLFRAKYDIQKALIDDMVEGQAHEQTQAAMETLRSSQPISSIFSMEEIPQGEVRPQDGKVMDLNGDMQPLPGSRTILNEHEGWPVSKQRYVSRFGENLDSPTDRQAFDGGLVESTSYPTSNATSRPSRTGATDNRNPSPLAGSDAPDHQLNHDILWELVEDGFHEMLDEVFKAKEQNDDEVVRTREERNHWKLQIQEELERRDSKKDPREKAEVYFSRSDDPNNVDSQHMPNIQPSFQVEIVPTDNQSLARREAEISQQRLEVLLTATGYSSIDQQQEDEDQHVPTRMLAATATVTSTPSATISADSCDDPTMPQNRPAGNDASVTAPPESIVNVSKQSVQSSNSADGSSEGLSKQRLEELATLEELDDGIKHRGGLGRLSYKEIEDMVQADDTKEVKGLVIGWLEMASF